MVRLNKCGHPTDWTFKLIGAGKKYTYCLGCLIEKTGVTHLEPYENKFIKNKQISTKTKTHEVDKEA